MPSRVHRPARFAIRSGGSTIGLRDHAVAGAHSRAHVVYEAGPAGERARPTGPDGLSVDRVRERSRAAITSSKTLVEDAVAGCDGR
jgi:hypothetical protein